MRNSVSRTLVLALGLLVATSCSTTQVSTQGPEGYTYGTFSVDEITYRIDIEPYRDGMPGANSDNVIIPMTIRTLEAGYHPWNTRFKFTRIKLHWGKKVFYRGDDFDHDEWLLNDGKTPTRNVIRLSHEKLPPSFDITVWFKDETGKRYKYLIKDAGVGWVN